MIALYVHSIDSQQQERRFDCRLNELETVLDTLSLIAAAGSTFLKIYLVEDNQRTNLSPQAFDGQNLTKPIRALQQQWETILTAPRPQPNPLSGPSPLEMMLDRIDQYETLMAEYDTSIAKIEKLMIQAHEWFADGSQKDQLLGHYHRIIHRHYQSLERAQVRRDQCLKKLAKLKPAYLL